MKAKTQTWATTSAKFFGFCKNLKIVLTPQKNNVNFKPSEAGFSLLTVLFSLIILTLLFATAQQNYLTHATTLKAILNRSERIDPVYSAEALALTLHTSETNEVSFELQGRQYNASAIGLSGLIDLNTSSSDQRVEFLSALNVQNAQEIGDQFVEWRKNENRLTSIADFLQFGTFTVKQAELIGTYATVHSGRPFVRWEHSPEELKELMMQTDSVPSVLKDPTIRINLRRDGVLVSTPIEINLGLKSRVKVLSR